MSWREARVDMGPERGGVVILAVEHCGLDEAGSNKKEVK